MKYNGIELVEITTPQIFDPQKEMFVWDDTQNTPIKSEVCAIIKRKNKNLAITTNIIAYAHCAEIPQPRRATNRELAKWLITGCGEYSNQIGLVTTAYTYDESDTNKAVNNYVKVRKWDDIAWHEPTIDYMLIK